MHHNGQPGLCDWRTPGWVLGGVRYAFDGPIALDPASSPDNPTRARSFYVALGLELSWEAENIFLNPPWSRKLGMPIKPWIEQLAMATAEQKILVCPASTNATWFQNHVFTADAILFPRGRIAYDPAPGVEAGRAPTFDSVVAYWGPGADRFRRAFAEVGTIR